MRTTLDIDDDVLAAARGLARQQKRTAGEVLSALARQALTGTVAGASEVREPEIVHGFRPFPANGKIVTNELIDELRDRDGA
jgi:hypothetical protein